MDHERLLPYAQRLDYRLAENGDEIYEWLEGLLEKTDCENLLDIDVEFASLRNIRIFDSLAEVLDEEFVSDEKTGVKDSMYRGMMFAFQVAERAQPGDRTEIVIGPYVKYLRRCDNPFQELFQDVRSYLNENREIRLLMDFYSDELDEGRDRHAHALLGAGLVFMLAERSMGERFLAGTQKPYEPEKPRSHEH